MSSHNCPNCGAPLADGLRCSHCGSDWTAPVEAPKTPKYHWAAFVSFGLAFPSILLIHAPFIGVIFSGFSLYMGFDALRAIRKKPDQYRGRIFAIIGMAISACTLAMMINIVKYYQGIGW